MVRRLGMEYFDDDRAVLLPVLGQKHDRHPAAAEFALDGRAVGEGGSE